MFNRTIFIGIAGMTAGCCLMAVAWADNEKTSAKEEIKTLMIQRRDVLRQRVEAIKGEYRAGRTAVDQVLQAQNEVLNAELELAESKEQRIALRKQVLANFGQIEQFAELNVRNGTGLIQEQLAANAARIAAKIALLREQAKE